MILGRNVRLRPIEKDDLPRYVKWFSDPDLRGYISMHLPLSMAQEEKWFEQSLTLKDRDTQSWAIDVQPADPLTYAGVTALVLCVAALSALLPARRATRVDPLIALRYE